ncbi:pentatricopeptide repeat-containing protein At5g39350-like [Selaginella moellendorffii]|uniref:pentatricopeptide repeat-containing protein At5g39350-like n=1 Tax=Selaginella moellendorffii TaxID=88036 RepID=UPI000D1CEF09|nr:pentatricopeptide repeat-containing protein At5g39350-like [Selaginella moellendorffii]|eukprot:XP_024543186.1 pentatricopeptide repeat-containing protein At5g39350-like [Selaginella moellendorffii]
MATRQLAPGRMPWRGLFVSSISTQCGSSSDLFDVSALLRLGGAKAALDYLDSRQGRDGFLDSSTLARLLLDCGRSSALAEGRRVHEYVVRSRFVRDAFLGNHLVHMYLKCQSFDEAERVFQSAACESFDVATWTAVIVARAGLGKWKLVFGQLDEMDRRGIPPDRVMIKTLLTACTKLGALEEGKLIQDRLAGTQLELDIGVLNLTINMYVKCGCLDGAVQTFARMKRRDVVSWTVMIGAYSQDGKFSLSLQLFREMLLEGTTPNSVTFVSILSGCEAPSSLEQGRQIHALVVESSLESHVVVANSLLGMYSRCRSWEDSRSLFDRMSVRDSVSWSTIIMACSREESHCRDALPLYRSMLHEGVMPKTLALSMVLEACGSLAELKGGKLVHAHVIESGLEGDLVGISLVNMYAKCGTVGEARKVFERINNRSRILWNSMITAYQERDPHEALHLFREMQPEGVSPDRITFMTVLNACVNAADLENGRTIHRRIVDSGFAADVRVATALFNMYAKCGSLGEARGVFDSMVFRDVVSWNNMIAAYVQGRDGEGAISLCWAMQLEGMRPDKATFASLLNACSDPNRLVDGRQIHSWIAESRLENDIVMVTGLITMYANCGSLNNAREIFDNIFSNSQQHHRDLFLWTSMITAYEQHGEYRKALELYEQMHSRQVEADRVTFISVLNACAHLSDLRQGQAIHARVMRRGLATDVAVANSIVFMYGKCGSFDEASIVFEKTKHKDISLWTALIASYARHGHGEQALWIFRRLRQDGIELSNLTFVAMLSACSHVGLIEEGCEFFASMAELGIEPNMEHYSCLVDLLARAGHLHTAEEFLSRMPVAANTIVLTALLAACRVHGDVERARRVAEKLEALDPESEAPYVTLSNIEMGDHSICYL